MSILSKFYSGNLALINEALQEGFEECMRSIEPQATHLEDGIFEFLDGIWGFRIPSHIWDNLPQNLSYEEREEREEERSLAIEAYKKTQSKLFVEWAMDNKQEVLDYYL